MKNSRIGDVVLSLWMGMMATVTSSAQTVVVDRETHQPVGGVIVLSKGGSFIDLTDSLGRLPKAAMSQDSVTLQHLAYKSLAASLPADTIRMQAVTYQMKEVEVTAKADYIKLRGYYREYNVANDTMLKYEDGMADYYIPLHGGKTRAIYFMSRQGTPGKSPLCIASWTEGITGVGIGEETLMERVAKRRQKGNRDTLSYILTDTLRGTTTAYLDLLGNDDNHTVTVNLLFYKAQLTDNEKVAVYKYDDGRLSQLNLISFCYHKRWWDKSKMLRKAATKGYVPVGEAVEDDFSEFYVTERDVVSKEQMKTAWKTRTGGENKCTIPSSVPQLSDKLLQELSRLKSMTQSKWEGKDITTPTHENK